jgi:hypothetical protein
MPKKERIPLPLNQGKSEYYSGGCTLCIFSWTPRGLVGAMTMTSCRVVFIDLLEIQEIYAYLFKRQPATHAPGLFGLGPNNKIQMASKEVWF